MRLRERSAKGRDYKNLPLISVTAKEMEGDRAKYLEAGAWDYIAKPVDFDLLLALLRVWIGRSRACRRAGTGLTCTR